MTRSERWAIIILVAAVILCDLLVTCSKQAHGQDDTHRGHRENHEWYQHLQSNQGYSCCNDKDCRPGSVWRDENGVVRARIEGDTIIVPPSAVLPDKLNMSPITGHICERAGYIYCALVGGAGG